MASVGPRPTETTASAVVEAINIVFEKAFRCETEEELAKTCLQEAERLTGSAFGWIGEVNEAGRLDTMAMSDPGWEACRMPGGDVLAAIQNLEVRGIWSSVLKDGRSQIINDPAVHPGRVGLPEGHPALRCFLGVPLKQAGQTIGMISLANKDGGYTPDDQAAVEALARPIVQTILRKRAEAELTEHQEQLAQLVEQRTAQLAEERDNTEHLNAVLRVIRNVNQLIVVEKDPAKLIVDACELLIETRGYYHAWIAMSPRPGHPALSAEAGLGDAFRPVAKAIEEGELPGCCRALAEQPIAVIDDPSTACDGCPLTCKDPNCSSVVAALVHVGHRHGVLGLAMPARHAGSAEELSLIREVAADLGLAMHGIEEREARTRAETKLRLMDTVFEASLAANSTADIDGIIEHVNPAFLELWGYDTKEAAIGNSVASFFANAEDAGPVLEALNTVGQWRGEFLGQRTDGSTYVSRGFATVVRDEQGEVVGYQSANLDVTAERRAQERLDKLFTAVTSIVDGMLHGELDDVQTEKRVLDACLAATDSRYGMIGAINEHGKFDVTAYGSTTLEDCAFPAATASDRSAGMTLRGVWGWPMAHGEPLLCNAPNDHPDQVGQPAGHVPIECFLGVPLKEADEVVGMVAIANKPGGYAPSDLDSLARLVDTMMVARTHRRALTEVRERTIQLESANHELESFAYSVSHDLRAPLRAIEGFGQALREDYADKLDDEGRDYLDRVTGETRRMAQLIDDLLKLSRVARAEMRTETVDLAAIGRDILAALRRAEPERRVEVTMPDRLEVKGDGRLLRQALDNLLSNAWKFTGRRDVATIELGAKGDDGERTYFLRDNGAGFDMQYANKLFAPFCRLHAMTEFPGNGVGLSTVQRVVKRHGGRVWFESEVDRGATFFFSLHGNGDKSNE